MAYRTDLKWIKDLPKFSDDEQKILLALSHENYSWRTRDRLIKLTGLEPKTFDTLLSALIEKNLVRPSFSKKRNIIFGLSERVD